MKGAGSQMRLQRAKRGLCPQYFDEGMDCF